MKQGAENEPLPHLIVTAAGLPWKSFFYPINASLSVNIIWLATQCLFKGLKTRGIINEKWAYCLNFLALFLFLEYKKYPLS